MPTIPVYLLSGLLAWNLFSVSLSSGAQSVIANANLVKKVYFPREILPLATVGVVARRLRAAVGRALRCSCSSPATGFTRPRPLWLYPMAFVALLPSPPRSTFLVSAMNVRYRDVQHLIGLGAARVVLADADRLPRRARAGEAARIRSGRLTAWQAVPAEPGGHDRVRVPARAVRTRPDVGDVLPCVHRSAELAGHARRRDRRVAPCLLYLTWRLYFSMSGDFAEEL